MTIYSKRFNAQRAAERMTAKTNEPHKIEATEGGFIVVKIMPAPAPAKAKSARKPRPFTGQAYADPKPAKSAPKAMGRPTASKRGEILAQAEAGILPAAPDFSAETHKPYRAKLAHLVELAAAGDAEALKAVAINPTSSSPKAMIRYRDLAVTAIKAQRGGAA